MIFYLLKTLMLNNRFQNNYDFLRFFAAMYVIFKHSYNLLGLKFPVNEIINGSIAMPVFFLISGQLITASAIYSPNIFTYFKKRFLRIFPGIIVMTFFVAFLIGPLFTNLSLSEYLKNIETYKYLISSSIYKIYYNLPGVFDDNLHTNCVNGSIWTLVYELFLYIVTGLIISITFFKDKKKWLLIALVIMFLIRALLAHRYYWYSYSHPLVLNLNIMYLFEWSFYFLIGANFHHFKNKIKLNWQTLSLLILIYILTLYFNLNNISSILHYIVVSYAVFFLGNLKGVFNKFGKYGDFSYGIYIYAYPIQQAIISSYPNINVGSLIVFSSLITFGLAVLSWYLVESPMLKKVKRIKSLV